jgi:hypothetical protein
MKGIEKTTVIVTVISGLFVLLAAIIGLFNPIATKLADRILSVPTATATLTPLPTATATFTVTPPPTSTSVPTRIPTLSPPQGNAVQFILANNDTAAHSFFLDGFFATDISSGAVLVFAAPGGTHQLEDCPHNENPIANPTDCDSERYDLNENPFDWTITGDAKPNPKVTLVLMNISPNAQTIYVDGTLARAVAANQYYLLDESPGKHTVQNCSGDSTSCSDTFDADWEAAVEFWKVGN